MNQPFFQQEKSSELSSFPHIIELATKKITTVQLHSLENESSEYLRCLQIIEGKHEWIINGQDHLLFPGDFALILPGQSFGGKQGFLDIGTVCWLHLKIKTLEEGGKMRLGDWSNLSELEMHTIGKILVLHSSCVLSRFHEAGVIIQEMQREIAAQEIAYMRSVNQLIEKLLIQTARQLTKQNNSRRDFPQAFMKLEESLRDNLSHQWTVEEMAALVGLGTTAFTEKVRRYTGFSPLNYLINIRISEAIKLLKKEYANLTDIALDTGFYSSQHFSTTFKKLTGYTPSQFRKNNLSNH